MPTAPSTNNRVFILFLSPIKSHSSINLSCFCFKTKVTSYLETQMNGNTHNCMVTVKLAIS